jgi:hypothetical protein
VVSESSQRVVAQTEKAAKEDGAVNGKLNGYAAIESPISLCCWVTKGGDSPECYRPLYYEHDKREVD